MVKNREGLISLASNKRDERKATEDVRKAMRKLNTLLLGEKYPLADEFYEDEDKIVLYATSITTSIVYNGKLATRVHSKATRTVEIASIRNKRTLIEVTYPRFFNPCDDGPKTIPEKMYFAQAYKRRTIDLDATIVCSSIFLSIAGAEEYLRGIGIMVSRSTIRRTFMVIKFKDDKYVVVIGVDDASIRKGRKYVTVIYDAKTGNCLAVLMGRDGSAFETWLQEHQNVEIVARDRASGYAKAIRKVNPAIIQVADRFHLFQNLNKYISDALKQVLPKELFVQEIDGKVLDKATYETSLEPPHEERLSRYSFDTSEPKDKYGNTILFDRTHRDKNTKEYRESLKRAAEKRKLIENVKSYAQTHTGHGSRKELCKIFNITQPTALKYIRMSEEDVEKASTPIEFMPKNSAEWDKYLNVIYKMHAEKIDPEDIFYYVYKMPGFNLNPRALANYVDVIGRNNFIGRRSFRIISVTNFKLPDGLVRFTRDDIIKFVTTVNPNTKKNQEVEKWIEAISDKYSAVKDAKEIAKEFHAIIMGEVDTPIEDFLIRHENSMIASLCKGIWADLDAVKNAIELPYNSGFVEGSNNLLKLTERISFGRLGIENLERKFKMRTRSKTLNARVISKMLFEEFNAEHYQELVPNYDDLPFVFE